MYHDQRLIILDADGTTIDAFSAIEQTFTSLDMSIGDLDRFQKRRKLFKYLGGLKEFPTNLKRQIGKQKRSKLIARLTEVYREQAALYQDMGSLIQALIDAPGVRVGIITRNITLEPELTLRRLFKRHDIDIDQLDFFHHLALKKDKLASFRELREQYRINPALAFACGDEKKDFMAAQGAGMHPFMVSYGFEDYDRLTVKIGVPAELISREPTELKERVLHALNLTHKPRPSVTSA